MCSLLVSFCLMHFLFAFSVLLLGWITVAYLCNERWLDSQILVLQLLQISYVSYQNTTRNQKRIFSPWVASTLGKTSSLSIPKEVHTHSPGDILWCSYLEAILSKLSHFQSYNRSILSFALFSTHITSHSQSSIALHLTLDIKLHQRLKDHNKLGTVTTRPKLIFSKLLISHSFEQISSLCTSSIYMNDTFPIVTHIVETPFKLKYGALVLTQPIGNVCVFLESTS